MISLLSPANVSEINLTPAFKDNAGIPEELQSKRDVVIQYIM